MARFFTKHEMAKYDKKFSEEDYLNTDRFKDQLRVEISKDNHRVNVDSAKKKAVLQGMNYDGFHQMVLGADLKGLKQGEIINISNNNSILNNINTQIKLNNPLEILKNAFVPKDVEDSGKEKILKDLAELKIEDQELLNKENNNKYDSKLFVKEWKLINVNFSNKIIDANINNNKNENKRELSKNLEEKVSFLKKINSENFRDILEEEKISSDVFLDLLNSIGELSIYFTISKDLNFVRELFEYLKILVNSKFYSSLKIFIGKKQKCFYQEFKKEIEKEEIKEFLTKTENKIDIDEILNLIEKNFKI